MALRRQTGYRKNERGAVLIQVLWVMAILTVITGSLAFVENLDIRLNRMFLNRFRARWAAEAGIQVAIAQLSRHGNEKFNHPGLSWWSDPNIYQNITVGQATFSVIPLSVELPQGYSQLEQPTPTVGLSDCEALLNANTVSLEVLERIPGITPAIAKGILVLRGDDPNEAAKPSSGSPPAHLPSRTEPMICARPISFIEQLLQVSGIDTKVLFGEPSSGLPGLVHYLTVRSNGRVNINTASTEVLTALGFSPDAATQIVARRQNGLWFKSVGELTSQHSSVSSATPLTVRSRNFIVRAAGKAFDDSFVLMKAHLCVGNYSIHILERSMSSSSSPTSNPLKKQ